MIERGRNNHNQCERHWANSVTRQRVRKQLRRACYDDRFEDEVVIERPWMSRSHGRQIKKSVLSNWLNSRVGQPWAQVFSDLVNEIGWDLVRQEVLHSRCRDVRKCTDIHAGGWDWLVDEHGILRKGKDYEGAKYEPYERPYYHDVFNGRYVTCIGGVYHWVVGTEWAWSKCRNPVMLKGKIEEPLNDDDLLLLYGLNGQDFQYVTHTAKHVLKRSAA
ncbi:MAG: hypothetical protein ABIH67_05320 [Candidatus Uhrbacteria bacterium]